MSQHQRIIRRSITDIQAMKGNAPIVVLTAYTAPMARLLDAHVDILLIGDSLGMVLYGFDSTLPVTLEMMIAHGAAVVRGSQQSLVVCDMPFASYQESPGQAFRNAARVLKETGCGCVKIEGGREMAETVRFLSERGIPVMSHVGLKPQYVHMHGGYKYQGRDEATRAAIINDALACEEAGACMLLLEGVAESLAAEITQRVRIPTIGIGASPACDGQVLVSEDMLGLFEQTPKFVQRFADLSAEITRGVAAYADAVRTRKFPTLTHCFGTRK
jgi:3-methyl-2-oxobutanoate hydroxymethyltransferase